MNQLKEYVDIKYNIDDGDIFITEKGIMKRKFEPKCYAITITKKKELLPLYLYYALQHLFEYQGYMKRMNAERVTLGLLNNIEIGKFK